MSRPEDLDSDVKMTSQVVRTLERKGLIEREVDAADTRAKRLRVTSAGAELAPRAIARAEDVDARFFEPVPVDDAIALVGALAPFPISASGTASAEHGRHP